MSGRLENKIAVVSGVASGIGRQTARLFAEEGALVIGCDIKSSSTGGGDVSGARIRVHQVNTTLPAAVSDFITHIAAEHGRIDCLVNAAATVRFARIDEMDYERDWRPTLVSEVDSVYLMVSNAWRLLKIAGASVINFASTAALRAQNPDGSLAHAAAKGAVLAMSRVIAFEGAPHQIRCNTVCPGFIETPATAQAIQSPFGRELVEKKIPLGRVGQPTDIAACCLYLASDESQWVTGANFTVDGGMMAT